MYREFQNRGIPATLIRNTDETLSPTDRVNRILAAYGNDPNVIVISNKFCKNIMTIKTMHNTNNTILTQSPYK